MKRIALALLSLVVFGLSREGIAQTATPTPIPIEVWVGGSSSEKIFHCTDGSTWTYCSTLPSGIVDISASSADAAWAICTGGTTGHVFKWDGTTWAYETSLPGLGESVTSSQIRAYNDDVVVAIGRNLEEKVRVYRRFSSTWSYLTQLSGIYTYGIANPERDTILLVGNLDIVKSTDGGITWATITSNTGLKYIASASGYVVAGTTSGILSSSDDGSSWIALTDFGGSWTNISPLGNGDIYAGKTNPDRVIYFNADSEEWTLLTTSYCGLDGYDRSNAYTVTAYGGTNHGVHYWNGSTLTTQTGGIDPNTNSLSVVKAETPAPSPSPTPCLAAIQVKKVGSLSITTTRGETISDWVIQAQNDDGSTVFCQVYDSENFSAMVTSTDVPTNLALRIATNAVGPAVETGDSFFVQYSDASDATVSAYLFVPATTYDITYYYGPNHRCYLDEGRCNPAPVYSPTPSVVPASPTPSPTPTAAPSPTPTAAPSPSPTAEPSPSASPTPSPSPVPSATPSPTPQASPTPEGYLTPTPTTVKEVPAAIMRRRLIRPDANTRSF